MIYGAFLWKSLQFFYLLYSRQFNFDIGSFHLCLCCLQLEMEDFFICIAFNLKTLSRFGDCINMIWFMFQIGNGSIFLESYLCGICLGGSERRSSQTVPSSNWFKRYALRIPQSLMKPLSLPSSRRLRNLRVRLYGRSASLIIIFLGQDISFI